MSAKDATVLLLDVGANTAEYDEMKSASFYEQAKNCAESIVLRKILTKPKDEVALFLIGTPSTDNALHEPKGDYEHISQALQMNPVSWDMLSYIRNSIDPPDKETTGDWVDAIIVALDYFSTLDLQKTSKKIILFTTFSTEVNPDSVQAVINGLKTLEIELIVVTKNVVSEVDENSEDQLEYASFSQTIGKSQERAKGERLILKIVSDTDGMLCSLDEALTKLIYVDKKKKRRVPWNCDLSIGSILKIKISAFIYVRDEKELGSWQTRCATGELCKSKIEHYYNDEKIDAEAIADLLCKGYFYGDVSVPFEDAASNTSEKGLLCIGCSPEKYIRQEYLAGESIWLIVPQKTSIVSAHRFNALVAAMRELNLVMIARYTYRDGTAPKLMALFPSDNSMQMMEILFKEGHMPVKFGILNSKSSTPSADQLNFMDKFIDAHDLTNYKAAPDQSPTELFNTLMDPGLQHMYRAIAHRAINPNDPVIKPEKEIMALITPPQKLDPSMETEMKELFPLKEEQLTGKAAFMKNLLKADNDGTTEDTVPNIVHSKENDVIKVGTVHPAEDFLNLLNRGEPINILVPQIQTVIIDLVLKSMISVDDKVHQALLVYRETVKEKIPFQYNEWITKFKETLKDRYKIDIWNLIVKENLGLITKDESEMSCVTTEEAIAFYKTGDDMTQKMVDDNLDTANVDDMFDDM